MSEIDVWRAEIDKINSQIIELIARREGICRKIGKYKQDNNLPIMDAEREREIFDKLEGLADEKGLDKKFINSLFRVMIENSRKIQKWKE